MEKALVTGVAGFIGSNLARELVSRGWAVRGIDNFETGRRSNLEGLRDLEAFTFVEGDIRDLDTMVQVTRDVSHVYHQAAVPSVPRSVDDPVSSTDVNCTGTATLVEAARRSDVSKIVAASSSSVYGSSETLPKRESMPDSPESPYALTKYFTEKLTVQVDELYGIDSVALRYFNIFGPWQDPDGEYAAVVPKFIKLLLAGRRPVIYGDGEQSRDFTYITNAVAANIDAANGSVSGEAVNVACGKRITLNELVDELNDIIGTDIEPRYDEQRPGDVRHSKADISKAAEMFGYEADIDVRTGLERTVDWFENQQSDD